MSARRLVEYQWRRYLDLYDGVRGRLAPRLCDRRHGETHGSSTAAGSGDYPDNWDDQGLAVDPNNPDRLFVDTFDTWLALRTGTAFYNLTCGYTGTAVANHNVHVDHHALTFVPGSSSLLLEGNDGGVFATTNADQAAEATFRPTWVNMYNGLNTIEFYAGDISGNFANDPEPHVVGGAQDNGPSSVKLLHADGSRAMADGIGRRRFLRADRSHGHGPNSGARDDDPDHWRCARWRYVHDRNSDVYLQDSAGEPVRGHAEHQHDHAG